jgi:hypothetical protein
VKNSDLREITVAFLPSELGCERPFISLSRSRLVGDYYREVNRHPVKARHANLTYDALRAGVAHRKRVRHSSTRSRLFAQVDLRREMRPIVFVDPGAFPGTSDQRLLFMYLRARKSAKAADKTESQNSPLPR